MSVPNALLQKWQFASSEATQSVVLPDGCQDLIFYFDGTRHRKCFVSSLAASAYSVASTSPAQFVGYRLQPGARINEARLVSAMAHYDGVDTNLAFNAIDDFVRLDQGVTQALQALAAAPRVAAAARDCGLSVRSLERLLASATGRAPSFWKRLARVRQAANGLLSAESLAALAADHGYADQAHMQRDFKAWFGVTPLQFRRDVTLLRTVAELGYGERASASLSIQLDIGVHSSTKNPSTSAT
jgi:AraC-like DNA-binding protein